MPLHLFTGGDDDVKCYYTHDHHKKYRAQYHKRKAEIILEDLDKVIVRAEELGRFPSEDELRVILRRIEVVIHGPLPFNWEMLRKALEGYKQGVSTFLSMMHCPAGVCNGEDLGSGTGIFKSAFTNGAKRCMFIS
jgi:hypothetical protein